MSAGPALSTERVVAVAAEIADRDGLDAVTLARVAAELGVRTPSLYHHVDGLDDVHRRLIRLALTELDQRLQQAAVGRAGADAVAALAVAYRDFARRRPGLAAATGRSARLGGHEPAARAVVDTVVAALSAYGLDGDGAIHATRILRSALHGFTSLERTGELDADADATFAWLVEVLTAGLAARARLSRTASTGGRSGP